MKELQTLFFETQDSFRSWLQANHDKSPGIWMEYYKKETQVPCIDYKEALRQALCFGWIDSTVRTLDKDRYVRMFTPRRNISNWSEVNKKLVLSLMEEGIMTEHGLRKIDGYLKTGTVQWPSAEPEAESRHPGIPDYILEEFALHEPALTNFNRLSKTNKAYFIRWITSAKREETIQNRLRESIAMLKEDKKLGMK